MTEMVGRNGREGMKINLSEGKRKRTGTELICSSVYDLISVDRLFSYMVLCLEEPVFPRVTQNPRGDSPSTWKIQNWPSPYSLVVAIPPF